MSINVALMIGLAAAIAKLLTMREDNLTTGKKIGAVGAIGIQVAGGAIIAHEAAAVAMAVVLAFITFHIGEAVGYGVGVKIDERIGGIDAQRHKREFERERGRTERIGIGDYKGERQVQR